MADYTFGLDPSTATAELRALADEIAAGRVVVCNRSRSVVNSTEDFEVRNLSITYTQRNDADPAP